MIKDTPEYAAVVKFYREQTTERSKVKLMRHIDEGVAVLEYLEATEYVQCAYCLHPLLQGDEQLRKSITLGLVSGCRPTIVVLAMEYRVIANGYLSTRKIKNISEIDLGPLEVEMKWMLTADKVQNRKDFIRYQQGHKNYKQLENYFHLWLVKLGVNEEMYQKLVKVCEQVD